MTTNADAQAYKARHRQTEGKRERETMIDRGERLSLSTI
jgi:hypothetical protein